MPNPAVFENYYEGPAVEPDGDEIWCYSDQPAYSPGETLILHVSTTAERFDLEIARDHLEFEIVYEKSNLPGKRHATPADVSVVGCGWPVACEIEIPLDWPTGGYRITCRIDTQSGIREQHHLVLIRNKQGNRSSRLALVSSTGTWLAYNNWGGSNHYEGIYGPKANAYAPIVSNQRPLPRGFVVLPEGAPRAALAAKPKPDEPISYPHMEFAYANGYSKKYASAGWASYERPFVQWAARNGFEVDLISQFDLQLRPDLVEDYACLAFIGHDEYWSWEMRDTIDSYVENGGRIARFAGNFMWQTRLEDAGRRQVCYKYIAASDDPMAGTDRETTSWEAPQLGRPGSLTFGLNAIHGVYAGWGGCVAFGSGGFPVYRPEHWAFEGTYLGYGDVLGADSRIFAYEVDGLDYVIRDGLPFPSETMQVPDDLEILALGLASNREIARGVSADELFLGADDGNFRAKILYGEVDDETSAIAGRGSGMIVSFHKGKGEVFHAGSVEWVAGLIRRDQPVERVTRNVLNRFLLQ